MAKSLSKIILLKNMLDSVQPQDATYVAPSNKIPNDPEVGNTINAIMQPMLNTIKTANMLPERTGDKTLDEKMQLIQNALMGGSGNGMTGTGGQSNPDNKPKGLGVDLTGQEKFNNDFDRKATSASMSSLPNHVQKAIIDNGLIGRAGLNDINKRFQEIGSPIRKLPDGGYTDGKIIY